MLLVASNDDDESLQWVLADQLPSFDRLLRSLGSRAADRGFLCNGRSVASACTDDGRNALFRSSDADGSRRRQLVLEVVGNLRMRSEECDMAASVKTNERGGKRARDRIFLSLSLSIRTCVHSQRFADLEVQHDFSLAFCSFSR